MWKRKLASRKFWVSVLALVSAFAVILGANEMQKNQAIAVVSAFSVLVTYVLSETISDSKNKKSGVIADPNAPIDWKRKFSSRKFWAALISFIGTLLIAFGCDNITIEQVNGLIGAMATMCVYILGEGIVDASNGSTPNETPNELEDLLNKAQDAANEVEENI